MPTCRRHGSGGARNAQVGLVRYLAWIIIGCNKDTPAKYARYVSIAAALEMMFNHGLGTVDQRMRAAQWILEVEVPPSTTGPNAATFDVRELLAEDTQATQGQ